MQINDILSIKLFFCKRCGFESKDSLDTVLLSGSMGVKVRVGMSKNENTKWEAKKKLSYKYKLFLTHFRKMLSKARWKFILELFANSERTKIVD